MTAVAARDKSGNRSSTSHALSSVIRFHRLLQRRRTLLVIRECRWERIGDEAKRAQDAHDDHQEHAHASQQNKQRFDQDLSPLNSLRSA